MKMKKYPFMVIFWLGLFIAAVFYSKSYAAPKADFAQSKIMDGNEISKKESVAVNIDKAEEIVRPIVTYSGAGLKDPFAPAVVKEKKEQETEARVEVKPLPELKVQGLLWGGIFPQAIINNKVVRVGDTLGEVKITAITKEGVTVLFANMEHKLSSPAVTGPQQSSNSNTPR